MEIEVCNWGKYQKGAKRYNSSAWFAMSNMLWQHPIWDELSGEEMKFYIFLLCLVSQRAHKTGKITTNTNNLMRLSGCSKNDIDSAVKSLCSHGVITVVAPTKHRSTLQDRTLHNRTEQEAKKTKHNALPTPTARPPEFGLDADLNKGTQLTVIRYYQAYQQRYGVGIRLTGKDIGILKRVVKSIGQPLCCDLIDVFLQTDDPWFIKKHHDLASFEQNLNQLQVNLKSGKTPTQRKKDDQGAELIRAIQEDEGEQETRVQPLSN